MPATENNETTLALVLKEMGALRAELTGIAGKVDNVQNEIKALAPNGDIDGHRRYHESLIESQNKRIKLIDSITEKILSGIAWAVIISVAAALWAWFKSQSKIP